MKKDETGSWIWRKSIQNQNKDRQECIKMLKTTNHHIVGYGAEYLLSVALAGHYLWTEVSSFGNHKKMKWQVSVNYNI